MEASDRIRVSGLTADVEQADVSPDTKRLMLALISRLDLALQDLVMQLKATPTVFTINPTLIEGAKDGDVAIFKNEDGAVDIKLYEEN